jgi:hypothetical protein
VEGTLGLRPFGATGLGGPSLGFDASSLQGLEKAERRAGRVLAGALALVCLVLAAGLLLFLAG